jgi:hypothetical protein
MSTKIIGDNDSTILYSSGWETYTSNQELERSKHGTNKTGSFAELSFEGVFLNFANIPT